MVQLLWKTLWQFQKKAKVTLGPSNSTPEYTLKRNQNLYTNTQSSTSANPKGKIPPQCPSAVKWAYMHSTAFRHKKQ